MHVQVQEQHRWLQQLVGAWTYENESRMGPDQPPMKFRGKESVRSLGDVWVLCEGQGDMPGGGVGYTQMTLGFDPARGRFVGTFIGSMMTYLWLYDGELDADGKRLTLNAEGPTMTGDGKMAQYRDIIEMVGPNERRLHAQIQLEDGTWQQFMTATYTRVQ